MFDPPSLRARFGDRRGRCLPPLSSVFTLRNKRGAAVEATGSGAGSGWVELMLMGWAWFHVPKAMPMLGEHSAPSGTIARVLRAADLAAPVELEVVYRSAVHSTIRRLPW